MAYTREQIAQIAFEAGWRNTEELIGIVAIVMRESAGNATAHRSDKDKALMRGDIGLAQINYKNLAQLAAIGITDPRQLFDPVTNLRAARYLFEKAKGWSPWGMGPNGWAAGGNPWKGTNRGAAASAVTAAANTGLLGKPWTGSVDLPGYAGGGTSYTGPSGASGGGSATPGATAAPPGPNASPQELEDYIRSNYGYMSGFLNIPEVRDVLFSAAREGWSADRLKGALSRTGWWQTTAEQTRLWEQLRSEDPAEAQRRVDLAMGSISDKAKSYGITLTQEQLATMAGDSARFGWTEDEVIDALMRNVRWGAGGNVQAGQLTASIDQMRALGGQYLMKLSDQTAQNYATRVARGEMTQEGVTSILKQQAKARFGYMADLIDQGVTVEDYFSPIRDVVASTLELGADQIDLTDPKWLRLIEVRDANGQIRAATMNEAQLAARRHNGGRDFMRTKQASELMAGIALGVRAGFGRGGR